MVTRYSVFQSIMFLLLTFKPLLTMAQSDKVNKSINLDCNSAAQIFMEFSHSPTSFTILGKTPYSSSQRAGIGFISPYSLQIFGTKFNLSTRFHPNIKYIYSKRDEGGRLDNIQGWSLDPLGLSSRVQLNKVTKLRNSIYGGFSYMSKAFPTDKGRKLNFNFELQTTIEQVIGNHYIVSFGGAFHHISNAQTGKQNPGIDSIYLLLRLSYLIE